MAEKRKTNELKPCPFCGQAAERYAWMNILGKFRPGCSPCDVFALSEEAWNKRADIRVIESGRAAHRSQRARKARKGAGK